MKNTNFFYLLLFSKLELSVWYFTGCALGDNPINNKPASAFPLVASAKTPWPRCNRRLSVCRPALSVVSLINAITLTLNQKIGPPLLGWVRFLILRSKHARPNCRVIYSRLGSDCATRPRLTDLVTFNKLLKSSIKLTNCVGILQHKNRIKNTIFSRLLTLVA